MGIFWRGVKRRFLSEKSGFSFLARASLCHFTMRTRIAIFVLSAFGLLNCGCSMIVLAQGKDLNVVFAPTATRQSVQREIGTPVGSQIYDYPINVPAFSLWSGSGRWQPNALAKGYDDYRYKGSIYDVAGCEQCDAMVLTLTLGLGEIWGFPESLRETAAERKKEHHFRVWYSPSGYCVAYRELPAEGQAKGASP